MQLPIERQLSGARGTGHGSKSVPDSVYCLSWEPRAESCELRATCSQLACIECMCNDVFYDPIGKQIFYDMLLKFGNASVPNIWYRLKQRQRHRQVNVLAKEPGARRQAPGGPRTADNTSFLIRKKLPAYDICEPLIDEAPLMLHKVRLNQCWQISCFVAQVGYFRRLILCFHS